MKSQIKRFSKSTLSVILSLCMLVSCMTVGIIATDAAYDDSESIGYDTVGIHTNATISGGWETTNLDTSDGNHYTGTIYFKGKSSGNYEMGMQVAGNWKVFGGYWINSGTAYNTAWGSGGSGNDQIPPSSTNTSKYIKGEVEFYKEYSGKPWLKITQTVLNDLATTATVGKTSLTSGGTTTVGNTSSGGSGSYTHEYTVKQGSASGTDVTNATLGSSTGTTFTAPSVSSNTKYYITHTLTDSNTGATVTSSAKTITVSPATTPSIDSFTIDGSTSKTLNIGETATLASTKSNSTNTVTYSTTSDAISITGTTVKALKPVSSVTITASLTGATSKTVTVTVRTPQFSLSYSPSSIPATGSATSTPTANINTSYANSSSTMSSLSYSITSGTSYASINSSTGVVTSKTSDGTVTVKVTGTISHNGVSYTSAEGTATVTVSSLPSVYFDVVYNKSSGWSDSDNKGGSMTYDSAASTTLGSMVFKLTTSSNLVANGSYYLRIWDGSDNYRPSSEISSQQLLSGSGVSCDKVNETKKMTAGAAGKYNFYYDVTNHKVYVEYPHTVTFNMNGHGTAPTSQTINYGGKVTKPNDPSAAGYTFGGWYKEATCTNAWNFSSDTVTANTTLYAKWTNLPAIAAPTIKYNNSTTATQTMNASKGSKARITWAAITNAGSYEIFKDNVSLGTTTDLYYDIERGNSYGGTYTVKAIPSNPNSYSTSVASNGIKFTFNKVALTQPNVSISATEIGVGDSTTVTISNYSTLSTYVTAGDAVIRRCTRTYNATTGSGTNDGSPTSSSDVLTPASSIQYFYYMEVTQAGSDYYSQSANSNLLNVYVSAPTWYLVGDLVDSSDNKWNTSLQDYPVDEYVSKNVFKRRVTYTSGNDSAKHYFRLNNGTNQYTVADGTDTNMSTHTTLATAVTANTATTSGAMYVTGQGTFTIYVNQSNKKVWVEKTEAQKYTTIVYVNQDSGATNMYVWKDANNHVSEWPGEDLTTASDKVTTETVNDIPYYKYTFESYWDHFDIVVNKGNRQNQSADLTNIAASKTYYVIWDGGSNTTASISETAPYIQLGYKKGDNGTVNHLDFNSSRTVSVTLDANSTYNFWMKSANTHYNDENSGTMTRLNCTGWHFPDKNTDTKIQTDLAGTYTFTYTVTNGEFYVSVTYPPEPKYDVTIDKGDHGTLKVDGAAVSVSRIVVQLGEITKAIVEAVAAEGYHFKAWTTTGGVAAESGYSLSSNPISIGASAAGTMTATYEENSYTLTLASAGNGSITTPASKTMTVHPYTATSLSGVTVTPANGYKFNGWTAGTGVTLSGQSSTTPSSGTVKASQDSTLTATFTKVSYSLTGQTSLNGTVGNYGTVKFYSNPGCTNEITTSQIGNTVYAKFTSSTHTLVNFTLVGTGTSNPTTDGNVFSFKMGYSNVILTANVSPQSSVTYYVDMHDNSMSGKTVQVAIVSNGGGTTVLKDGEGEDCSATLVQQGNSTVYAAEINTPTTKTDTDTYGDLYVKVTYTGKNPSTINVPGTKVETLVNSHEMWLEAENEASSPLTFTYGNRTTPTVQNGYRRIYLAKPYSWQDDDPDKWENIGIYHWGNYTDIGWNKGIKMHHLGYSGTGENDYHYYYADIPKALDSTGTTVVTNGTGNKVSNIIFQGWGSNTSAGDYSKAQTGNIENIPDSANFYILSEEDGAYVGTKSEDDAVIPNYTRYVSSVTLNKTESKEAKIAPTYTGKITYTSKNTSIVTVDSDGTIHPQARGTTKITVNIYGTIDDIVKDHVDEDHKEYLTYDVNVTVRDPEQFNGFEIMSLESKTYTVNIPVVNNNQPGYFDMNNVVMTVEGIKGVASSTTSAIITTTATTVVSGVGTMPTAFTVKYAKANTDFAGYDEINIIGKVTTKSIKLSNTQRYGHDHWTEDGITKSFTTSRVINNGIETATTNGISFDDTKETYSAVFVPYDYVDVTFTFTYYEYKPKVDEDGMINYPYDANYAGTEDRTSASFNTSTHTLRTVTVQNYEVRGTTANDVQPSDLVVPALTAIGALPGNNYYSYSIAAGNINISNRNKSGYTANAAVNMTHSVKEYRVYLNGELKQRNVQGDSRKTYYYQEYAELTVNTASDWYAVESRDSNDTTNAPLLATGVNSYKFRVKGSGTDNNTYLRTTDATNPHGKDFLRSEVDFSHYEVTHQGSTPTSMKEYLMQNFYIADFFSPANVLDPQSYTGKGKFGVAYKVEEVAASTTASSGDITVYFTDSLDWNNICIYYWGENINNINWPGLAMTQSGTDADNKKIYSAVIPGTAEGVIFTGNNNQTVDITNNISNGSHWKSINETVRNGIPYDDAKFVGGGVVYFSVDEQGNPRSSNAKDLGYVNSDGTLNQDAVKEMLKSEILSSVNEGNYGKYTVEEDGQTVQKSVSYESLENAIGTEDALKVAYGTEIEAHQYVENSIKTGVLYRYLPLETFSNDSKKWSNGVPVKDENGNYYTTLNNNTFRYSNTLQSYQYVYASGNENKETNAGKNMRLYSYYVYSYVAYNQETNVPETKYEIVISDNYSDASTYWAGNPNPNPAN